MVLVPLEPDEAPARLAHILSEVRAAHLQAEYRRTRTTCAIYTRLLTGGPFDLPVSLSQVCPSVIVTQDNEVRLRVLSAIASLDGADEAKAWRGSGLEVLTVHQVQDLASSTEAGPSNAASGCLDAELSAEIAMGLQAGDVGAEQVSHVCFTSGSSGLPKGCILSHRALQARRPWRLSFLLQLTRSSRCLCCLRAGS
jgi:acyl-CoA synthetase (AMP-forming)/AMP-acid ligase II